MADDPKPPAFYGNVFQISRTPWDVTLHVFLGNPPLDTKPGTTVNLLESAAHVAAITMPVEVAKLLITALQISTGDDAITVESINVGRKEAGDGSR